jgi:class 3 adenylate cyclase
MEQGDQERKAKRRLAAILAADISGYSRLMGLDEEGTLRVLKDHREAPRSVDCGASRAHRQDDRRWHARRIC